MYNMIHFLGCTSKYPHTASFSTATILPIRYSSDEESGEDVWCRRQWCHTPKGAQMCESTVFFMRMIKQQKAIKHGAEATVVWSMLPTKNGACGQKWPNVGYIYIYIQCICIYIYIMDHYGSVYFVMRRWSGHWRSIIFWDILGPDWLELVAAKAVDTGHL